MNKRYFRYWAENNPRNLHKRPFYILRKSLFDFTTRDNRFIPSKIYVESQMILNAKRYVEMVNTYFLPELEECETDDQTLFPVG